VYQSPKKILSESPLPRKIDVLFICAHNAARSQIAEGYMNARYGNRYHAFSAGTRSSSVSRHAVATMKEIGIDISMQLSKSLAAIEGREMDIAVILCDGREGTCPVYPWAKEVVHTHFTDPREFVGSEEEVQARFRSLREEITHWIDEYFG
jgi:arsenate reductase